ncbi:MAG: hypothetical protein ABSH22_03855 [Tepidisphaeraceae bacterium]|jgi:hypothetical protein
MLGNSRHPSPAAEAVAEYVRQRMIQRELAIYGKIAILLLCGLPALFIGPFLSGALICDLAGGFGYHLDLALVMPYANAVVIPLLFWAEYKTEGTFLSRAVANYKESSFYGDFSGLRIFLYRPILGSIGWVEISLWGPRQVLDAIGRIRAMAALRSADRNQAESILLRLATSHCGIAINELLDGEALNIGGLSAIAYLLFFDWVAASFDTNTVWASSETKAALNA